ncbi:MAG: hypothetical protein WC878_05820 [Candidatus Paceibacterota bacterium]|jgi:hypothetical protein
MNTITIPRKEYQELVETRMRYDFLRSAMDSDIFSPPPTKSAGTVIKGFKATGKYNAKFLESLKKGLSRSSYFKS